MYSEWIMKVKFANISPIAMNLRWNDHECVLLVVAPNVLFQLPPAIANIQGVGSPHLMASCRFDLLLIKISVYHL